MEQRRRLGENIKRLRKERGLSQARLGGRAGVDPSTVNQIERGARKPSTGTLERLAEALGVEMAELFEGYEVPKAEPPLPFNEVEGRGRPRRQVVVLAAHDFDLDWALSAPDEEFANEISAYEGDRAYDESHLKNLIALERVMIDRLRELRERHPVGPDKKLAMPAEVFVLLERTRDVQLQIFEKRGLLGMDPEEAPTTPEINREAAKLLDPVEMLQQLNEAPV